MVVYQQKTVYLNITAKNETDQKCWFFKLMVIKCSIIPKH